MVITNSFATLPTESQCSTFLQKVIMKLFQSWNELFPFYKARTSASPLQFSTCTSFLKLLSSWKRKVSTFNRRDEAPGPTRTDKVLDQDRDRIVRQRYAMVDQARRASTFGIIVSTKPGQSNPQIALSILKQVEEAGKKAVILYADEVVPQKLLDFTDIDVFVDTACPRLALDDPERFPKPIITRDEIMVAVGAWTWEQLLERGLVRL